MQDDVLLLVGLISLTLVALIAAIVFCRMFPYLKFLEWFGTVFLTLAWYSLIIPTTIEIVIPGKWTNGVQLVGFVAANLFPLGFLYWSLARRRKAYRSRQGVETHA